MGEAAKATSTADKIYLNAAMSLEALHQEASLRKGGDFFRNSGNNNVDKHYL